MPGPASLTRISTHSSRAFVDTSGVLAFLFSTDAAHQAAKRAFERLTTRRAQLVTTSYVLTEIHALLARRRGLLAVSGFRERFAPLLSVIWVDERLHEQGLDLLLDQDRRSLSLVDCVSFVAMRAQRIVEVFAVDDDFEREGFEVVR